MSRLQRPCPLQSYLQKLQPAAAPGDSVAFPSPKPEDLETDWRQWLRLPHRLLDLPWVHPLRETLLHDLEESILASWGTEHRRPFPEGVTERREALADLARKWIEAPHRLPPESVYLMQAEPLHTENGAPATPVWLLVGGEEFSPLPDQMLALYHPEAPEGPMEGAVRVVGPVARLHAEEVSMWARLARLEGREWFAKPVLRPARS